MRLKKIHIILLSLLWIFPFTLYAQLQNQQIFIDSLKNKNEINFGVDKIVNTYTFHANAFLKYKLLGGELTFLQNYRGTALQTNQTVFRDDENMQISFERPIYEKFSITNQNNWVYSSNTRSIGINKLERLNSRLGLKYNNYNNSFFELNAGYESNHQVGFDATGAILGAYGKLNNLQFSDFIFNASLFSEYLQLESNRINSDIDFTSSLYGQFSLGNTLYFNLRYKQQGRDLFNQYTIDGINRAFLENRQENRFNSNIGIEYLISDLFSINSRMSINHLSVDRAYYESIPGVANSNMLRRLNEFQVFSYIETIYRSKKLFHSLSLSYDFRDERNISNKKFDEISPENELMLKNFERQRDNQAARTRLSTSTAVNLTKSDTLKFDYSVSIMRYDTPSPQNNDDRDEFNNIVSLSYHKRFSDKLSMSLKLETHQSHLVFLKSSRSSMNNWNRILSLKPEIQFQTSHFSMNPKMEVLANYTVYDYESSVNSMKSFSYRQISFRDTLFLKLSNEYNVQASYVLRYFERSLLFWDSFSEYPQSSNFEQFYKILAFTNASDRISIGCGVRYYSLTQKNLTKQPMTASDDLFHFSIGPETNIIFRFNEKLALSLLGWYEYQKINNNWREIPNFFLNTHYFL